MNQYLNALKVPIRKYFLSLKKQLEWMLDPFIGDAMDANLITFPKEQLIEVLCAPTLKIKYLTVGTTLLDLWIGIRKEYKEMSSFGLTVVLRQIGRRLGRRFTSSA
ncbi:hypothetical protein QYM36_005664 [Artemia franciscana]|uniref:Uncharacterized protein n=1 Tax=Artemia franciscana TaxID=6661 RepID=A0AA88LEC0_ARTSF|nr:hypothetical protein QYM36_005664 [Artemia franciscana]